MSRFIRSAYFLKLVSFSLVVMSLASNCTTEEGVGGNFYYANWTCGSSSQCVTVMGAQSGTAGPFCDEPLCNAWGKKFIPGGYTCSTSPSKTPTSGTPPNGKCFQLGDF